MPEYTVLDNDTGREVTFQWNGDKQPTDTDMQDVFSAARGQTPKRSSGAERSFDVEPMAEIRMGLERTQRDIIPDMPPKEIGRSIVEGLGMAGGAGVGALVPIPGSSIVGAGLGYSAAKRLANMALDEPIDSTIKGIGTDIALGGALQGATKLLSKIPGVRDVIAPPEANIGPSGTFGKGAIDKAAYAIMEKSMKIPPSVKPPIRERAITTALNEEVPITKAGLNRTKDIIATLNNDMDNAVVNSSMKNNPINTDDVLGPVMEFRSWIEKTVGGNKLTGKLDKVVKGFKDQYGDVITVEQAQNIKKNTNAFLKKAYGELKPVETEATKQIVRGLKNRIATEIPEISGINAKYGDMKTLETALERAVNRTGNWDWFSLSAGMAGAITGGATGSMVKATEAVGLWRLLKSPGVQSHIAISLKKAGMGTKANVLADTITTNVFNKLTSNDKEPSEVETEGSE